MNERQWLVVGAAAGVLLALGGLPVRPNGTGGAVGAALAQAGVWSLAGNAGTQPGLNFLGTTDERALELRVNSRRALRLEPSAASPNLIGGAEANAAFDGVVGATIGGGGTLTGGPNRVTDDYGTVGGGVGNTAGSGAPGQGTLATVGGGASNTAHGQAATIGGGDTNRAGATAATVAGGFQNSATGSFAAVGGGGQNSATRDYATVAGGGQNAATAGSATVGGGFQNMAGGDGATVPGGAYNAAQGTGSFAAGSHAKALHPGTFVWGDSSSADITSTVPNEFIVRASGGVTLYADPTASSGVVLQPGSGSWASVSDVAAKTNFEAADPAAVLEGVARLPIATWSYRGQDPAIRHIGPTAQAFAAAFGVGEDDRHISTVDADGVALAAIQALHAEVRARDAQLAAQAERLASLEAQHAALQADHAALAARLAALEQAQRR